MSLKTFCRWNFAKNWRRRTEIFLRKTKFARESFQLLSTKLSCIDEIIFIFTISCRRRTEVCKKKFRGRVSKCSRSRKKSFGTFKKFREDFCTQFSPDINYPISWWPEIILRSTKRLAGIIYCETFDLRQRQKRVGGKVEKLQIKTNYSCTKLFRSDTFTSREFGKIDLSQPIQISRTHKRNDFEDKQILSISKPTRSHSPDDHNKYFTLNVSNFVRALKQMTENKLTQINITPIIILR